MGSQLADYDWARIERTCKVFEARRQQEGVSYAQVAERGGLDLETVREALTGERPRGQALEIDKRLNTMMDNGLQSDLPAYESPEGRFVPTYNGLQVYGLLERTWSERLMTVAVGPTGSGKTRATQEYVQRHLGGVVYLAVRPGMRGKEIIKRLAEGLGLDSWGPGSEIEDRVAEEMVRKQCLVIFDESDWLAPSTFGLLRTTCWDLTQVDGEAQAGVCWLGTEDWFQRLGKLHQRAGMMGQFIGRFQDHVILKKCSNEDVTLFGEHFGLKSDCVSVLIDGARGDLRRAKAAISRARKQGRGQVIARQLVQAFGKLPTL